MQNVDKVSHIKYPEDLSPNRYVSLEFFTPKNEKNLKDLLSHLKDIGVSLYHTMQGKEGATKDVSGAFSSLESSSAKFVTGAVSEMTNTAKTNNGFNSRELKAILYLPLPNNLNDRASNSFSESSGIISNLISKVGNNSAMNSVNEIANSIGTRNVMANSDMNQIYKGSNLRSATFVWTFMPRSKKDAENIINIIKTIKKYSSPDAAISRHFLLAPAFVNVTLSNPQLNDLQRYADMVINEVSIDYGSSGNMEMFYDGMLKEITVSISLSELKINTLQDWEDDKTHQNAKNSSETYRQKSINTQKQL